MNSMLMETAQVKALPEAVKELEDCEGCEPDDMVHFIHNDIIQVSLTSVMESRYICRDGKIFATKKEALDAEGYDN